MAIVSKDNIFAAHIKAWPRRIRLQRVYAYGVMCTDLVRQNHAN